jgi:hypothetical protein
LGFLLTRDPVLRDNQTSQNEGSLSLPMTKNKTRTNYRRADTGEYTTEQYAKKHPKTTVKETDQVVNKKKPSSGKKNK